MKPFNCVLTNKFALSKNRITDKLFTYKSYMYNHLIVSKRMTDVELLMLYSNTWNYLNVFKQMSSGLFKKVTYKLFIYKSLSLYLYIYIYIYIYIYTIFKNLLIGWVLWQFDPFRLFNANQPTLKIFNKSELK